MPDPYIRPAQPDDDADLVLLDRLTWSPLHAVLPEPRPPYPPFFSEGHDAHDTLVAEDGGRLLGYVRLGRPTPLPANAHVRQIQGLAVHGDARGRGLGRALIRAVTEEARRRGARRITLRVLGHNIPARRLYESEGFTVEGVLPGEFHLDGQYVDDVLMGRPL